MKKLILILLVLQSQLVYSAIIISDLDDTIKMTNVKSPAQAARNVLLSTKVFEPMPKLLAEMDKYTDETHIVSASPKILNTRIKKLLEKHQIQYKELHTRGFADLLDKKKFKIETINNLIKNDKEVILIGDNTQADDDIYQTLKKMNPDKTFTIYIHKVTESGKISDSSFSFITAFDIAVNEYKEKRMNFYGVTTVANQIIKTLKIKSVMSSFAYCPTNRSELDSRIPLELKPFGFAVQTRIVQYCKQRNK